MRNKWVLAFAVLTLFGASPSVSAVKTAEGGEQLFKIPVKLRSELFLPKYAGRLNHRFEVPSAVPPTAPSKTGLVLPAEIYEPKEKIKGEGFSCGQPTDKSLYAKGVEAFNGGDYRRAKEYFERLLAEYPSSPFTLKAAYYLGVIEFKEGNYDRAYEIFKNLCKSPYAFPWKDYACYNAVISALRLGKFAEAEELARPYSFWRSLVLWLQNRIGDSELLKNLNCSSLEEPYRNYCLYLRAYLNPSQRVELPPKYAKSVELKKVLTAAGGGGYLSTEEVRRYLSTPLGTKILEVHTYGLIKRGDYRNALRWLAELYRRDKNAARNLAIFLIEKNPAFGGEVLKVVPDRKVAEVYAKVLYNAGDYRRALEVAKRYGFYGVGGLAAYRLGDYRLSAELLSKVPVKDRLTYRVLLEDYLRLGRLEELKNLLKEVEKRYPDLYREYLGWYYYYKRDWEKAAQYLNDPLYKATCYYNLGEYGKVLSLIQNADNPHARLLLAETYLALGRLDRAAEVLEGVNLPDAYFLKGLVLFARGNYREAAYYFEKVKNAPKGLLWLAHSYYNLGDYGRAKELYLEFIRRYPNDPRVGDAYMGLVNIYLNAGDTSLARYLSGVAEKFPDLLSEEVKVKLTESLLKNGETRRAYEIARSLVDSKNPFVRGRALLILAAADPKNAPRYLEEAVRLRLPEISSRAVEMLVDYHLRRGEVKKAKTLVEKYGNLINSPDKLLGLYLRTGEFDKAYKLLKQLIAADNRYTLRAFEIAKRYKRAEFFNLSLNSLDAKVATLSARALVEHHLKEKNLRDALKVVMLLKVRGVRYEPYYSEAFAEVVNALYSAGYLKDACKLLTEVNESKLPPAERGKIEKIKKVCGS